MEESELQQIVRWAALVPHNGIIVEVGSFKGRSTIAWSTSCDPSVTVYSMDFFNDYAEPYYAAFLENTKDITNIRPISCIVPYTMPNWTDQMIDVFFLDGMHKNPADIDGIKYFLPWIKKGGMICGHDYMVEEWPDVVENTRTLEKILDKSVTLYEGTTLWSFTI